MHPLLSASLSGALAVLVALALVWLLSLWKRDASIIDVFWGLGFVLVAWTYRFAGPPAELRQQLLLLLVSVWGIRLALYIGWRNWREGEDRRYRKMRQHWGESFWWVSWFRVFLVQGVLLWLIATPLLVVQASTVEPGWRWSDFLGLALWLTGFFFEAVGDIQMARFKSDPANAGKVLDRGLWRYTRHPNYFGDCLVWWGYFSFALGAPGGYWTLPAALLMQFLLLRVSGVALLEKTISERRPRYQEYIETTPAFFPGRPKDAR